MTQEELLDAVDRQIITAPPFALGGYTRFLQALRAVVELHQPVWTFPEGSNNSVPICLQCRDGGFEADYPCTTIQAIEKALV